MPRSLTFKNLLRMIAVGMICLAYIFSFSGCVYTKEAAIRKFGCKTDSIRVDSNTTHQVDTFYKPFYLPADTVKIPSPCDDIEKMKPGESKKTKSKRTTAIIGKDTAGKAYFICLADEYKDSMEWYKEKWYTTVYTTEYRHQPYELKWYNHPENIVIITLLGVFLILALLYFFKPK
jgi:hypothetical protein